MCVVWSPWLVGSPSSPRFAGMKAGLSAAEAARLGTEAAEKAATSGAFTAPNWRTDEAATTSTTTTTTTTEEPVVVKAGMRKKDT